MKSLALKDHCDSDINRTVDQVMEVGILKLKAIHNEHNLARFYTIRIDRNLWDHITVITSYGRIRTHGNVKHAYFEEAKEAQDYLKLVLRKRFNSEKRIGTQYKIT